MNVARRITADDLGAALRRAQQAVDRALAARSAGATAAVVHRGARKMVQEPWRIVRALGDSAATEEPLSGPENLADAIARCEQLLAASEAQAAAGHWTFDLNRHLALRQARVALWRLRIGELMGEGRAAGAEKDQRRTA